MIAAGAMGMSARLGAQAPQGRGAAPPPPPPTVLNLGSLAVTVQSLDASVAFYRDGLALDLVSPPTAASVDEARNTVMGTPGARSRSARFAIPNEPFAIELIEYTGIDRTPMMARHNDPGASFFNVGYLDVGAVFDALRKFNPRMVGQGALPTTANPAGLNATWIRDPDGMIIEVMHGGWDGPLKSFPSVRNAYRAHFGVTMEQYTQALTFYRDLLGFALTPGFGGGAAGEYRPAGGLSRMLGVPAEANWTGVEGHCANAHCEMFEFKDAPRTPFRPRAQDPGAVYLSVWVSDLDALLNRMKAAGIDIVTRGGAPVTVSHAGRVDVVSGAGPTGGPTRVNTSRQILVRDPGGFLVLLMQRTS
jgi:catechol 2,3-dioxygenase-like lactoylglutathione lyase family enzyme